MKINLLLIACLNLIWISSFGKQKDVFAEAEILFKTQNFSGCIELLESYSDSSFLPKSDEVKWLLSKAYLGNQHPEKAKETLKAIIPQNNSTKYRKQMLLARCFSQLGVADSVRNILQTLTLDNLQDKTDDLLPDFLSLRALYQHDYDSALLDFRKAAKRVGEDDPRILEIYMHMADRFELLSQRDSADYYTDRGILLQKKKFPRDTIGLINLYLQKAYHLFSANRFADSEEFYKERISPLLFRPHTINQRKYEFLQTTYIRCLILTLSANGDYFECIRLGKQYLQLAKKFHPNGHFRYGEVHREIANAYLGLKRISSYIKHMTLATEIFDSVDFYRYSNLRYKLMLNMALRDYEKCIAYADTFLLENNTFSNHTLDASYYRLYAHLQLKAYQKAEIESVHLLRRLINTGDFTSSDLVKYQVPYLIALERQRMRASKHDRFTQDIDLKLDSLYQPIVAQISNKTTNEINSEERSILILYASRKEYLLQYDSAHFFTYLALQSNLTEGIDKLLSGDIAGQGKDQQQLLESLWLLGKVCLAEYEASGDKSSLQKAALFYTKANEINKNSTFVKGSVDDKITNLDIQYFNLEDEFINTVYRYTQAFDNQDSYSQAWKAMEQKKAQILVTELSDLSEKKFKRLPDSLQLLYNSLTSQLNYLQQRIGYYHPSSKSIRLASYRMTLQIAQEKFQDLKGHLLKQYAYNPALRERQQTIELNDVYARLQPNEAILHYFVQKQDTYVMVIRKDQSTLKKYPTLPDSVIKKFRQAIMPAQMTANMDKVYRDYVASAANIFNRIFKLIQPDLTGVDRITVIPDGNLHYIPFEALLSSHETSTGNFKDINYLVKDYTFSYAYSATSLYAGQSLFPGINSKKEVLALAPSYQLPQNSNLATRDILYDLEWSDEEIQSISESFNGEFVKDKQATKSAFLAKANNYDILHLAAHAIVNEHDPMASFLAFSNDEVTASSQTLRAEEIYEMEIDAEMVVLSACNTGYGKLLRGEGAMSLAKAFTYAGSPSVIMSHWPANDEISSKIMSRFYEYLSQGKDKDVALRLSKLDFLASAPHYQQSPTFWNNYVVLGDVKPIVNSNLYYYLSLAAFILSLFGILFLIRKRRKTKYKTLHQSSS